MTRRKEIFTTMKLSVARLPIAVGNPNLSRVLHADMMDSYIGLLTQKDPIVVGLCKFQVLARADDVWVNTRSGKYWRPGSRFYGKTKQGEYMPELDALDRGYYPAGGTGQ